MDQYPIHGKPDYSNENDGNPYKETVTSNTRGEPYTTDLAGRSTMVSDSVEMTKRLRAFVPRSSVKQPIAEGTGQEPAQDNYEAKYQ